MFEEAADISPKEIKAYRNFDPTNDPFFSVENATTWITSLGYQLYLLQDDTVVSTSSYNPEDASTKELRAYRNCDFVVPIQMVGDDFLGHAFFSLENTAIPLHIIAIVVQIPRHSVREHPPGPNHRLIVLFLGEQPGIVCAILPGQLTGLLGSI
ncbi:hypothetical protein B0H13DRAFT_2359851 [Mycena leptocephala]|nr:hypothetical protein B0H13DRAFT_2359851 [Mycena leptocephala]